MFKNIGVKIKDLAKFLCWVGIIICVGIGFLIIANSNSIGYNYYGRTGTIVLGVVIMVGGSILSWLSTMLLYGFGELIDNTSEIRRKLND